MSQFRNHNEQDRQLARAINNFFDGYKYQKSPKDLSLLQEAEKIFFKIDSKPVNFLWSLTAMMDFYLYIYHRLEKGEMNAEDEKNMPSQNLLCYKEKAKTIFNKIPLDRLDERLVSTGIKLSKTIEEIDNLFTYAEKRGFVNYDFYICSEYCIALLFNFENYYDKSLAAFNKYKNVFAFNKADDDNRRSKKLAQQRRVYDEFIGFQVKKENFPEALRLFQEAQTKEIYENNVLKESKEKEKDFVQLNFHFEDKKLGKKITEFGGITSSVAKVAILYFAKTYIDQGIHLTVKIITGGIHCKEDSHQLKKEIPDFLKHYCPTCEIKWDDNLWCFSISFPAMRTVCCGIEEQAIKEELKDNSIEMQRKITWVQADCAADIARQKRGNPYKQFTTDPAEINAEFQGRPDMIDDLRKGMRLLQEKSNKAAYEHFTMCIKKYPAMSWTYEHLGLVNHRLRNYSEAIKNYEKAFQCSSRNNKQLAEINRKIGFAHYRHFSERTDHERECLEAIEFYKKAIWWDPENIEIYHNYGMALDHLKRYDEAIDMFEKVIANNSEHDEACIRLGKIYAKQHSYDKAMECYNEALKRNRASSWAREEREKISGKSNTLSVIDQKTESDNDSNFSLSK